MSDQLCTVEGRRQAVLDEGTLNGVDHVEVLDQDAPSAAQRQRILRVRLLRPLTAGELGPGNVRVEGGRRVRGFRVVSAAPDAADPRVLVVELDRAGDFSPYTLRLVARSTSEDPPAGFDARLASAVFSFKVDCPSDFDCAGEQACVPEPGPAPRIDYLTKDWPGFRRLMLDRLSVLLPEWRTAGPADLGTTIVEALAHVADQLSYAQDAAGTEAYLGTARLRSSVRRHARLLDYHLHDGANARAWVALEAAAGGGADGATLPAGTLVLTRVDAPEGGIAPAGLPDALAQAPLVFATCHDVRLSAARNRIAFHTWSDSVCCLPRGATRASLADPGDALDFAPGDVLVFEEVRGPESGAALDADPAHRQAVRLVSVERVVDPVDGTVVREIAWHAEDALAFPLRLSARLVDETGETPIPEVSVARGNVVLADHGMPVGARALLPADPPASGRWSPELRDADVTVATPYDHDVARAEPAAGTARQDPRRARPAVRLTEPDGTVWTAVRDLLPADAFARAFVVEREEDGRARLRFGDGVHGRRPPVDVRLLAGYRVGGGSAGNVGAESLAHVVTPLAGVTRVRNPLPASGGADAEPAIQARLHAPQAFRVQERAITTDDYATMAERHPQVAKAAATLRWTGSWHTVFVTVDRAAGRPVDRAFREELLAFLERFRLAGHDLKVDAPRFVALDVALTICVAPGYRRAEVGRAVAETLSAADLPDGTRGLFHPDAFTFGQPVHLSLLVAAAMGVPGVRWVDIAPRAPGAERPHRFRRFGGEDAGELAAGRIEMGRLEIARCDSDPSTPENGRVRVWLEGGL